MSKKPRQGKTKKNKTTAGEPGRVDLSEQDKDDLINRLRSSNLKEKDQKLLIDLINAVHWMNQMLSRKALSIRRMMRLFGFKSEKAAVVFSDDKNTDHTDDKKDDDSDKPSPPPPKPKPKGHGKSSAKDFPGAKRVLHEHDSLTVGDRCPECHNGNLGQLEPGKLVRFYGKAPLEVMVHEYERLRCNTCGKIYSAELPKEIPKERTDEKANALVCLFRYMGGFPHYRLAKFQTALGARLPESSQWGMVERVAKPAYRVWSRLIEKAAGLDLYHNDDTGMRIQGLSLELKNSKDPKVRKGIYTTGVVAKGDGKDIALFFTSNRHAGENLARVLKHRKEDLATPLQMCDALSRNPAKHFETILCFCMDHGRRGFVDVARDFPEETKHVIGKIAEVYKYDKTSKKFHMTDSERLQLHKTYSLPILEDLKVWCEKKLENKEVEPNSGFGEAIRYFLKHWDKLTSFCRYEGAPLSNAEVERLLKTAITHRKNSLQYKTEMGALIGDVMMSLIQTCVRMKINPFDYLVALQKNVKAVFSDPDAWLPWNYKAALTQ